MHENQVPKYTNLKFLSHTSKQFRFDFYPCKKFSHLHVLSNDILKL